jgi:uridine kinase
MNREGLQSPCPALSGRLPARGEGNLQPAKPAVTLVAPALLWLNDIPMGGIIARRHPRISLGIAGGTGSGKTTIAEEVCRDLGPDNAVIIHQDSYYLDRTLLPSDERERINFDHPSAFDWKLLKKHLHALRRGRAIQKPTYNFHTHSRMPETTRVDPRPVLIVEGILVFDDPELRAMMGMRIYVDADADVRFIRRLDRDVRERGRSLESIIDQYMNTVRPMHLQFVEPSKRYADIIIPEGGHNRVALDTIIARIRAMI